MNTIIRAKKAYEKPSYSVLDVDQTLTRNPCAAAKYIIRPTPAYDPGALLVTSKEQFQREDRKQTAV